MNAYDIFSVPFDKSVISRPGARFAPERIIHYLRKLYLPEGIELNIKEPPEDFNRWDVRVAHEKIHSWVRENLEEGAFPVFIGGDHSITFPLYRAVKEKFGGNPLIIINIDAHYDIRDWSDESITSGTPFKRIMDFGLAEPSHIIEIGIRPMSNSPQLEERAEGIQIFTLDEVKEEGIDGILGRVKDMVQEHPVYFTFDMDVMEGGCCPGSSAAHPYGLSMEEALKIVDTVAGMNVIAMDVVEVSPPWDVQDMTSKAAAYLIGRFIRRRHLKV